MGKFSQLIKYSLSSIASWAIDVGMFLLLKILLDARLGDFSDLVCTAAARAVSSFFNFNANNRLVFGHRGDYGRALLRYYCLAVPIMLCHVLGVSAPTLSTAIKVCVDVLLYLASFTIQKKWVFSQKHDKTDSR